MLAIVLSMLAALQAQAEEAGGQALSCETRGAYIESLSSADDPLKRRLGQLYGEPDAQFCRTIRVRVSPDNDPAWDLSLPDLSALAWLLRALAIILLLAACIWLIANWRRAGPASPEPDNIGRARRMERRAWRQPDSPPDDIPAAALSAWSGGDPRLALSLLYRGAVTALLPGDAANSATEGEVLRAIKAAPTGPETEAWMQQLTSAWQRTAWASQTPGNAEFQALHQAWNRHCGGQGR